MVRSINYENIKSRDRLGNPGPLQRAQSRLSVESQYDPNKVQRAAVVLKEYLAERGRQFATVEPGSAIRSRLPRSKSYFQSNEGPKVKVGKITIDGNHAFTQREVIRAMKNSHGYGIPYSILFENIFAATYDSDQARRRQGAHPRRVPVQGLFHGPGARPNVRRFVDTGGHGFRCR